MFSFFTFNSTCAETFFSHFLPTKRMPWATTCDQKLFAVPHRERETEEKRGEKVMVATRELLALTPELKLSVENEKKKEKSIFRAERFEVFPLPLLYSFFFPQWSCFKRAKNNFALCLWPETNIPAW